MKIPQSDLRRYRDVVLKYLYDNGAGMPSFSVPYNQIERDLGFSQDILNQIWMIMHNQGLDATPGMGGCLGLSDAGQREAERLGPSVMMREPPPSGSVTINASGYSIVQLAGANSTQTASVSSAQTTLMSTLDEIERELPRLRLQDVQRDEARGLVAGLRQAIRDRLPEAGIRAMGAGLKGLLTAAGSDLGHRLGQLIGITGG